MIPARGWLVVAIWAAFLALLYIAPVRAGEPVRLVVTLSCDDVRALDRMIGWDALEVRAKAAGASPVIIEQARKCLSR